MKGNEMKRREVKINGRKIEIELIRYDVNVMEGCTMALKIFLHCNLFVVTSTEME